MYAGNPKNKKGAVYNSKRGVALTGVPPAVLLAVPRENLTNLWEMDSCYVDSRQRKFRYIYSNYTYTCMYVRSMTIDMSTS